MSDPESQSREKVVDRESIDEKDEQDLEAANANLNAVSTSATNAKKTPAGVSSKMASVQLDRGGQDDESNYIFRRHWWQLWLPKDPPPPPPDSLEDAPIIPVIEASLLSKLTYTWITPIMVLGYQRTLQASDLWRMDESREAGVLTAKLDAAWDRRVKKAALWNERLANGEIHPSLFKRAVWTFKALSSPSSFGERRAGLETHWRDVDGRKRASLAWALNDTLGKDFWLGGIFKVIGDTSQTMGPLVVKAIIKFSQKRYQAQQDGTKPPSMGDGVAMAIGVFCITVMASVCQHQFFWRSMTTGVLARTALTGSIYRRGMRLTGKERMKITNAKLINHISTDVSRIDACAQWFHAAWTAPIQVMVCLIVLLVDMGPSALAGFALFVLMVPIQEQVMALQFSVGRKFMRWTDQRAKLLLEVLGAMRVVKYFSYEQPFLKRLYGIRKQELKGVSKTQMAQAGNLALAFSIPALAATLGFLTYTLTAHQLNAATIFSSLSLFQLLRQPLLFLPRSLSATMDARNAIQRLLPIFDAELVQEELIAIDKEQELAISVKGASFTWEEVLRESEEVKGRDGKGSKKGNLSRKHSFDEAVKEPTPEKPFEMRDINLEVKRGQLVAVVGRVGCGKSSLLHGLVGQMRRTAGNVTFGGSVAFCQQTAWIQNATLRDNVLFGQGFDEERYWQALEASCLIPDLQVLPDGDLTEIGEKGINLSGGQRARVNIARALYSNADVVVFDDPLSAVDAHVAKALLEGAIIQHLRNAGKSVLLVTHALHFLPQCDYIYALSNTGGIGEQGTYADLIERDGEFARLDREFGGNSTPENQGEEIEEVKPANIISTNEVYDAVKAKSTRAAAMGTGKLEGRLTIKEKRTTGSVSWKVYLTYFAAGRGQFTLPFIILFMLLMQGSQIMNSYTLVWWEVNHWNKPNSFYQILYGCLGIAQATFTFFLGVSVNIMSYYVSRNLHHQSIYNIFHAPMSFFDTTPLGRVLGVFGKDVDTIDNQLPTSMRMFLLQVANVIGAVILISTLEHYFLIVVFLAGFGYKHFQNFYSSSAREMKRLDAMLRSLLYAHFSESLSGLATIRSYGATERFIREDWNYVDLENRALFLTVTNQRWMAVRLDFIGAILVFFIAIFAVSGVSGINPSEIGLVLTYMTSITQMLGMLTRQSAEVENYMNSVERVVHYARSDIIPQEAPHEIEDKRPPTQWPQSGAIEFKDIKMSYRPGLPNVLHGISMHVSGGEKIGVVGRTGAGKSSLMLALFRIVELSEGSICIDGVDIASLGLTDLRSKISIIPQEPLLFSGTVRSNLDPFSLYDDARLWDALRRSYLVDGESANEKMSFEDDETIGRNQINRFSLDTIIESEGANLSVGQRSLLSLARALVKDSKVVVMDEATASVDLETDSKIQRTIQTQFKDRTLLCIAHRLRTIISYDRILVLDAGKVVEFDTPLRLFMKEDGVFRSMCERSSISQADIERSVFQ